MASNQRKMLFRDENNLQRNPIRRKLSVESKILGKKQALSEIKNIIHSTDSTPRNKIKRNSNNVRRTSQTLHFKPSPCLQFNKSSKPQEEIQVKLKNNIKPRTEFLPFDDEWEIPSPRTCSSSCSKDLTEIWAEMNMLSSEELEKFVKVSFKSNTPEKSNDLKELDFSEEDLKEVYISDTIDNWGVFEDEGSCNSTEFRLLSPLPLNLLDI